MTDPVDLPTRAADRLDALIAAAQPGPWMSGKDADHLSDRVVYGQSTTWPGRITQACNVEYADGGTANAEYIAAMDPVVGTALVEQLRRTAADAAIHVPAWQEAHDRLLGVWLRRREEGVDGDPPAAVDLLVEDHYEPMLAIARAVLGEPLELRNVAAEGLPTGDTRSTRVRADVASVRMIGPLHVRVNDCQGPNVTQSVTDCQ